MHSGSEYDGGFAGAPGGSLPGRGGRSGVLAALSPRRLRLADSQLPSERPSVFRRSHRLHIRGIKVSHHGRFLLDAFRLHCSETLVPVVLAGLRLTGKLL